ncbi:MAG TPA: hypothetical protein VK155_02620 [Bacteroidales bacterium]|nr:hypothetical protein [Bacteroidales bacterium]
MKKEELEILLAKYYDGTISPHDEEVLRRYFTSDDVPDGYEAEKAIFSYFNSAAPEPSSGFESRIIKGIEVSRKAKMRRIIYYVSSAAASIVFIISAVFFLDSRNKPEDTFKDPQLAYAETLKILYSISTQLNRGMEALEPVSKINDFDIQGFEVFDRSMKTLRKEMKNLEPLNVAIQIADTIQIK